MEIGGYIEFPHFAGRVLHNEAIALNSARNCLAYLIEAKKIKKIAIPKFLCASIEQVCMQYDLKIRYYSIGKDFFPQDLQLENEEWMYLVNYYGQISNAKINKIKELYERLIVDNVQAFFQMPLSNVDTIYTCRKYFGVPDGAFLYTNVNIDRVLDQDKSVERMTHLLGRYESSASEYYSDYIENEGIFENLPIRKMSKLTKNLLRGIDYEKVKDIRERNYLLLEHRFASINKLSLCIPEGAFMYPLYVPNGAVIRERLRKKKIYIATLWPDVLKICKESELEYNFAENILPLPCDQRYDMQDINWMTKMILEEL